jgi:hypothetical protein
MFYIIKYIELLNNLNILFYNLFLVYLVDLVVWLDI